MHYKNPAADGEDLRAVCLLIHRHQELQAMIEAKPTVYMTGISGMTVGFPLVCKYGLNFAVLRKPGEQSHGDTLQGEIPGCGEILIVDDFVNSGATVVRMLREANLLDEPERVSVLLYDQSEPPTWEYFGEEIRRCIREGKVPYGFKSVEDADRAWRALTEINWVTL